MKKLSILMVVISILTVSVYANTYIGMGFTREISGYQRNFINGRITFGDTLTIDIEGSFLLSNPNPTEFAQFYTYINLNIPISNFEIYAGFSPTLFFSGGVFYPELIQSMGYLHAGIALKLQRIRIYGELLKTIYYSPFNLSDGTVANVGAQIGF